MTEHKYTDEEVIKALEIHSDNGAPCYDMQCPYVNELRCGSKMAKDTISLINRQKAEIAFWMDAAANAKKEAVKEFAERLKKEAGYFGRAVAVETINDLVQELTEEKT